jgi:hypothetical protein
VDGLNLAIELTGIDGNCCYASIAMRKYNLITRSVNIYNIIDNLATRHPAWVTDAVCTSITGLSDSAMPGVWSELREWYGPDVAHPSYPDGLKTRQEAGGDAQNRPCH